MAWILAEQKSVVVAASYPSPVMVGHSIPGSALPGTVVRFWVDAQNKGTTGWIGIVMDAFGLEIEDTFAEVSGGATFRFILDFQMPKRDVTVQITLFYWDQATRPSYGPAGGVTEAVRIGGSSLGTSLGHSWILDGQKSFTVKLQEEPPKFFGIPWWILAGLGGSLAVVTVVGVVAYNQQQQMMMMAMMRR